MNDARTPLYECHVAEGAKMTTFAGWRMPLHYGSQIAEHHQVRRAAGMFDVSHMTIIDLAGAGALGFLQRVFANDAAKAVPGRAVYGVLLNDAAGIVDDVIVYGRVEGGEQCFRVVANAATRRRVVDWLGECAAGYAVSLRERRDLAIIACQGPQALRSFEAATGVAVAAMAPFAALEDGHWFVARTGYTGEDGVEAILPSEQAADLWRRLGSAGVAPTGLAARDTLRLEAGLNLSGQDMDETTTPLESNLAWSVAWEPADRAFIGRERLAMLRAAKPREALRGIVMEGRGVMRHGNRVASERGEGVVTSGTFSPTLGYSIGLARLPRGARGTCTVALRDRSGPVRPARIVRPPFVRHGRRVYE